LKEGGGKEEEEEEEAAAGEEERGAGCARAEAGAENWRRNLLTHLHSLAVLPCPCLLCLT
jgi:hypothetical protein